jgi:hypothetical protein
LIKLTSEGVDEPPHNQNSPHVVLCEALWKGMQEQLARFDEAHRSCSTNADCMSVPDQVCVGACYRSAPTVSKQEREALMLAIDAKECKQFLRSKCTDVEPAAVPSCAAAVPVCRAGACVDGR